MQCEIVEVASVEDATGYPSGSDASGRCRDCGAHLCDDHGESCERCNELFCSTCLAFHQMAYHQKKPAAEYRKYRKCHAPVPHINNATSNSRLRASPLACGECSKQATRSANKNMARHVDCHCSRKPHVSRPMVGKPDVRYRQRGERFVDASQRC